MKYLLIFVITLFLTCSSNSNIGGSISDVDLEIATLYGYVVNEVGNAVEHAEIVLFKPDSLLSQIGDIGTAIDTLYTDANGKYEFDSINYGTYSILANYEDSLYADNLFINHDSLTFTGVDTLKEPGHIKGTVQLDNNNNMGVLVYIPGTNHIAVSDSAGNFILENVSSDSASNVVFQYYGYAIIQVSEVTVPSGDTVTLSPVILTKNEYPIGVKGIMDTVHNTVTLTWDGMNSIDVIGYLIYRKDSSETASFPVLLNNSELLKDTIFTDTLEEELFSQSDTITFQYHIKAKNYKEDLTPFSNPVFIRAYTKRDFTTKKTLAITSPSNKDSIHGLDNHLITWQYTGLIDSVGVFFTPNDGGSWFPVSNVEKNKGQFSWSVPNISSENCKIKIIDIVDSLLYDESDIFKIIAIDNSNIIKNGDFSQGVAYWYLNNVEGAKSNINTSEGQGAIIIDSIGEESWHVAFAQRGIPLMQGYVYRITFDAYSTSDKKIAVGLAMGKAPWTTYSQANYTISSVPGTYSSELFMPMADDYSSDLIFALGLDTADIVLDNISLEIVK